MLPANIEQHLILGSRGEEANYDDIKRMAFAWVMTSAAGKDEKEETTKNDGPAGPVFKNVFYKFFTC